MIVLVNKYFPGKGFAGITLWPFVILKEEAYRKDKVLLNHERIHYKQQAELLVLPFYLWYCIEFLIKYPLYRNFYLTYRNLSFEREAYAYEKDLSYCSKRKFWGFLSFLHSKS